MRHVYDLHVLRGHYDPAPVIGLARMIIGQMSKLMDINSRRTAIIR